GAPTRSSGPWSSWWKISGRGGSVGASLTTSSSSRTETPSPPWSPASRAARTSRPSGAAPLHLDAGRRDLVLNDPVAHRAPPVLPHWQTDLHPERLGVPVDHRPVELVEHEDLDRVCRRVHRLDAVHHHAPRACGKVEVDERAHRVEGVAVRRLPVPVELEAAVGCRNREVAHAPDP